uniref:Uncharacterized protein n=1 Tax=Zea mays TaxID=4577 RepID=A0A804Q868_MAIZE
MPSSDLAQVAAVTLLGACSSPLRVVHLQHFPPASRGPSTSSPCAQIPSPYALAPTQLRAPLCRCPSPLLALLRRGPCSAISSTQLAMAVAA